MSRGFGPEQLLDCYRRGVFPMADDKDDPRLFLIDPDLRGVMPLDEFYASRSLRKTIRQDKFTVRADTAFVSVIEGCARARPGRETTWINTPIVNLYSTLHRLGHAHSVECWKDGELVGGLYGVSLGGAFFGESMFSNERDASKVAMAHLVARLRAAGYQLLDTQFLTDHLKSLGAREVSRDVFQVQLKKALKVKANFHTLAGRGQSVAGSDVMQLITQTS